MKTETIKTNRTKNLRFRRRSRSTSFIPLFTRGHHFGSEIRAFCCCTETRQSIDCRASPPLQPNCTFACVHVQTTSLIEPQASLVMCKVGAPFKLVLSEFRLRPGSGMQHTRTRTRMVGREGSAPSCAKCRSGGHSAAVVWERVASDNKLNE